MTLAKKIILISITLILIISSFLLVMNSFAFSSEEGKKYEKYDLEDFIGNKFYLFEYLSGGYSIYTESNEFIEGSYTDLSPYHNFIDKKILYLGPGLYFYELGEKVFNIVENRFENKDKYKDCDFALNRISESKYSKSVPNSISTHLDENNYRVINNDYYFRNLKRMPHNELGTCGLVALSMLLGYLDLFANPSIIPNDVYNSDPVPRNFGYSNNINEVLKILNYKNINDMPGTNNSFQNLLFDNYMHTIAGIHSEDGYPMAATELELTYAKYKKHELSTAVAKNIKQTSGALFYTHAKPKELIDRGIPCLIVMSKFTLGRNIGDKDKYHIAMAYGYSGDAFLVNMGWGAGRTETIISKATIHSYYTLEYTGTHEHSYRVRGDRKGIGSFLPEEHYSSCSCGRIINKDGVALN